MQRFTSIFILFSLLSCSLASMRVFSCAGSGCGTEQSTACSAKKDGYKTESEQSGCGKDREGNSGCCAPNCCCYLLPVIDLPCLDFAEEIVEKPQGIQHRYPQSFDDSIWHPPAKEKALKTIPRNAFLFNFSISTT